MLIELECAINRVYINVKFGLVWVSIIVFNRAVRVFADRSNPIRRY
jgi:hypothetical protein